MPEVVVFPDAVALVVDYLRDELAVRSPSATVGTEVPNPRPALFVTVQRFGGPRRNFVTDEPHIGLECWADREQDAHDLCQLCRALVLALQGQTVGGVFVSRTGEVGGPASLPDPLSDQPRYTATLTVAVRGSTT